MTIIDFYKQDLQLIQITTHQQYSEVQLDPQTGHIDQIIKDPMTQESESYAIINTDNNSHDPRLVFQRLDDAIEYIKNHDVTL